ncbi:MAG: GxxExxY protein, partial [Rhodospirillales bacterium]|nr:GxxExxY protein [Rhodospirillales bacterium]
EEPTKKDIYEPVPPDTERLASQVVDAAFKVHSALGPGLLESVYETCLLHELKGRNLKSQRQVALPIVYEGLRISSGLRLDLLIEERVVVELKAVEKILPVFNAQLLTYLKLSGHRLGLLINFNVPRIKDGIRRIIL